MKIIKHYFTKDRENSLEQCYHESDKNINVTICKFKLKKLNNLGHKTREKSLDEGGYGMKTDRTQEKNKWEKIYR